MKKVGIITFHWADNFGAVLQVYALLKTVEKYGFDVEIINYRPAELIEGYLLFENLNNVYRRLGLLRTIKYILVRILKYKNIKQRIDNFSKFRKDHLNISSVVYLTGNDLLKNKPYYDYYITGSDQVWNPDFFKKIGNSYFLDFAVDGAIKISYAASIARELNEEHYQYYKLNLNKFDYISIREKTHKELIEKLSNRKVQVTLDPTLLLTKEDWNRISTYTEIKEKYILVYDLIKDPTIVFVANRIAAKNNFKIISFSGKKGFINWHSTFSSCNPTEFLGLFNNTELIVTSSFHGTAFSILFNKKFYTIPHPTRGSRMIDLLNELELSNRIISSEEEHISINDTIDYEKVNVKLTGMREQSIDFLERALGVYK